MLVPLALPWTDFFSSCDILILKVLVCVFEVALPGWTLIVATVACFFVADAGNVLAPDSASLFAVDAVMGRTIINAAAGAGVLACTGVASILISSWLSPKL